MTLLLLILCATSASVFLTWLLRRYALAKSIIDVPNARSSHSVPTPRGGGIGIVLSFLIALPILEALGLANAPVVWALLGSGGAIALLGFLDDHGHIAARWRLAGHFLAAGWALFWLGGFPPINAWGFSLDLGWAGNVLGIIFFVWMLNLYNFMDGIDGIASIEAICVCVSGSFLYLYIGEPNVAVMPIVLAATVLGFLFWNFPPAKIFMGDAGSGFLGVVIATFAIQAAWVAPQLFWSWIILLGVFIVDATTTLLHRMVRREKIYEAHRSHAYQFAARRYKSHKLVTVAVALLNCFWLFPWAFLVASSRIDGVLAMVFAYLPIVVIAWKFKAGARE